MYRFKKMLSIYRVSCLKDRCKNTNNNYFQASTFTPLLYYIIFK